MPIKPPLLLVFYLQNVLAVRVNNEKSVVGLAGPRLLIRVQEVLGSNSGQTFNQPIFLDSEKLIYQ